MSRPPIPPTEASAAEGRRPMQPVGVRLYCRVIDNFGDAGVAWRLARQLVAEHGCRVTLVIDAPDALVRLLDRGEAGPVRASLAGAAASARVSGVTIERWPGRDVGLPPDTDLVIAAFGCELPTPVRAALAPAEPAPPCWANLEYLSAERWVDDTHGLPSIKPADGAIEWFVMPGFGPRTGGLLRERDLFAARDAFLRARRGPDWLAGVGVPDAGDALRVSLFCYPHAPIAPLLDAAARSARRSQWLVPDGVAPAALQAWLGRAPPAPGEAIERGAVQLVGLPWLPQPDYDRLLWSCDLNFVRGEDSWVRAVWAARPFVWQPYRQDDGAHHAKLTAFLDRLLEGAPAPAAATLRAVHRRWLGEAADADVEAHVEADVEADVRADVRANVRVDIDADAGADVKADADARVDAVSASPDGWPALVAAITSPMLAGHLRGFAQRTAEVPDLASTLLALARTGRCPRP